VVIEDPLPNGTRLESSSPRQLNEPASPLLATTEARVRQGKPLPRRSTCVECAAVWLPADEERWRAYHGGDDLDEPAELFFYSPECAEREVGAPVKE
jgi:hypothetical protein